MKILIVSPGESSFVVREGKGYCVNGAKVRLLVPHIPGRKTKELLMPDYEVFRVRYFWPEQAQILFHLVDNFYMNFGLKKALLSLIFIPRFLWAVTLHARGFDIIHCQWSTSILFALPAKWLWGCKLVVTVRGTDLRDFPKWLNRYLLKRVDFSIDCFSGTFWSQTNKKMFPSNWVSLPQLLNEKLKGEPKLYTTIESFHNLNQNKLKVVYTGRLDLEKIELGNAPIFELLDVMTEAKREGFGFSLVYFGGGELLNKLKQRCIELGVKNEVLFCGHVSNPEAYFHLFDFGVGGISINAVAQEYAMAELPQLQPRFCVDFPYGENYWTDRGNIYLFEPKSVKSLAKAIREVLATPELAKNIGKKSKLRVSGSAVEFIAGGKMYLSSFNKLLKSEKHKK
jgi:glycosyltransferase involved in cell wall biosynthesis